MAMISTSFDDADYDIDEEDEEMDEHHKHNDKKYKSKSTKNHHINTTNTSHQIAEDDQRDAGAPLVHVECPLDVELRHEP